MNSIHRKMSIEEFHDFPWRLGWKHEYYGGKLHATVASTAILYFRLPLTPRPEKSGVALRPVCAKDRAGLIALYRLAFADAPEFIDLDRRRFFDQATDNIDRYFREPDQRWHGASCLAAEGRRILAAA